MTAWTDERIKELQRLDEEGLSAAQIAEKLGGVTRNAIIGKLHRLRAEEKARDQQDIDILCDLAEGHSQADCASYWGVSKSHVQKLAAARREAA